MNENPPLTAAAITTLANAVRAEAAREDRLARQGQAVKDQWNAIRAARRARARAERKHA